MPEELKKVFLEGMDVTVESFIRSRPRSSEPYLIAAACADERSRASGKVSPDSVRAESRCLIEAARRCGCLLAPDDIPGTRYTIHTGESEVRMVQREQVYYKIKNPFAKSHLKKHPIRYAVYEHVIHNILFPDAPLEFLGIVDEWNEARFVYRQIAVRSESRPSDAQIAIEMRLRGMSPEQKYCFGNDMVFVTDIGQDSDNVLLGDDGNLYFIDPIIGFKDQLQRLLDAPLDLDSEIDSLVYRLYGLTEDEIAVVEGRNNPVAETLHDPAHLSAGSCCH